MNKEPYRNSGDAGESRGSAAGGRPRGRPRVFVDAAAKQRAQRQREREKLRWVQELLCAARSASWDDPHVHRQLQHGDDVDALAALTEYYRQRCWYRPRSVVAGTADGAASPSEPSFPGSVGGPPSD